MKSLIPTLPLLTALLLSPFAPLHAAEFKAGAAVVDITPPKLPVLVNGGMLSRSVDKIKTRIHARAIALSDGKEQIVIVVADSCMMCRPLLDEAKAFAEKRTGVPANRMTISATHAHSVPSSMGCLGTDPDPAYVPFLRDKLVEAIVAAQAALAPARVGFAKGNAAEFTALRQWIRRPDRIVEDPFGNMTVRANMHAGRNWDDATGEAGPEDPDLSLIAFQARDGRPLAVLANFSMHYFGDKDISADYFGLFSEGLKERIAPGSGFVGIMSHGCSGDIWRRDYTRPESWNDKLTIDDYAKGLVNIAMTAYKGIRYRDGVDLAMAERRMTLNYRVPDKQRLEWAERIVAGMTNRLAKTTTEVYAREQIILHERQKTEIVVQALRIGDIGIATTPNETYAVTGLKIKAASPLPHNMVIELANGGDGYIPPPEQHLFGGYNTWAARSAGLEVQAEPKIAEVGIALLEKVSGQPRREWKLRDGPAARAILALKPAAYWRMNEFTAPHASDACGHGRDAVYEREITYYLEGPHSAHFCGHGEVNRAPHFVGGRLRARLGGLGDRYSVSMWLWNGMPNDGRDVSGWLFSRDHNHGLGPFGDHLGIGGKSGHTGRLVFFHGDAAATAAAGSTVIPRWQWQHVVLVRDGQTLRVWLNGQLEIVAKAAANFPAGLDQCFFGGRSDNDSNWEGRLDEIAVFNRALTAKEVARLVVK
ncbi:MAG: LamG domain-containing protein [Verrucomicrobia bacterium]|nr:LamG domain-containing protein [Verrucomicrobiota bacterium]